MSIIRLVLSWFGIAIDFHGGGLSGVQLWDLGSGEVYYPRSPIPCVHAGVCPWYCPGTCDDWMTKACWIPEDIRLPVLRALHSLRLGRERS